MQIGSVDREQLNPPVKEILLEDWNLLKEVVIESAREISVATPVSNCGRVKLIP